MKYTYCVDGEQWCIADEQTPDSELQMGLDWACGLGGANCSKIQKGQSCYQPNTVRAHASYAFNNYFQKMKHRGGNCYFKGSAIITGLDPSKFFILLFLMVMFFDLSFIDLRIVR